MQNKGTRMSFSGRDNLPWLSMALMDICLNLSSGWVTQYVGTLEAQVLELPGSLVVKTLPSNVGHAGLIAGQGMKTPHALWPPPKKKIKT